MIKVSMVCHVDADNKHEAEGHVMQMMADYYKHYPESKVDSLELE